MGRAGKEEERKRVGRGREEGGKREGRGREEGKREGEEREGRQEHLTCTWHCKGVEKMSV